MALLSNATAAGSGAPTAIGPGATVAVSGSTTAGAGTATVNIEVSHDNAIWLTHSTVNLTLSTTPAAGIIEMGDAYYPYVRATIPTGGISGTGAKVTATMCGGK